MSAPHVYAAVAAVTAALSGKGIGKNRTNEQEKYQFRGIDDVFNHLSPLLAEHRLCVLPRILERERIERRNLQGGALVSVCVKAAFDLVSAEDGSSHTIETFGEALDGGDKATSKALSAAFKSAILQAFCIPVTGRDDADSETHKLKVPDTAPEPPQGWPQWTADLEEVVRVCESDEALDRLQCTNRNLLKAISLERRDLYDRIGASVRSRRAALKPKPRRKKPSTSTTSKTPRPSAVKAEAHA